MSLMRAIPVRRLAAIDAQRIGHSELAGKLGKGGFAPPTLLPLAHAAQCVLTAPSICGTAGGGN